MGVCPVCLQPVSPTCEHVESVDGRSTNWWHRECWRLEHEAEPIDFADLERADRVEREAAWQARGGRRGAGL